MSVEAVKTAFLATLGELHKYTTSEVPTDAEEQKQRLRNIENLLTCEIVFRKKLEEVGNAGLFLCLMCGRSLRPEDVYAVKETLLPEPTDEVAEWVASCQAHSKTKIFRLVADDPLIE